MEWTKLVPAETTKIPQTGNPWIDYLIGAIVPICLGIIYLLVKWLKLYLKNKINKQKLEEIKLTQEIEINSKGGK